ncbi:hypothetical protein [Aquisphaera insulae]|uniref:hypothetical protein n=1 Tax=Aquisphaera insulae TaxID=2712864 RepID=UPI0013EAE115|nr:hypothetical protein [Aquisphaera insulae]
MWRVGPSHPDRCEATRRSRRASLLLEMEIAFAVLGVMLAGLCPYVITQIRQARYLEREQPLTSANSSVYHAIKPYSITSVTMRKNPFVEDGGLQTATAGPLFYYQITPWTNRWTRKLAGRARITQWAYDSQHEAWEASTQVVPATSPAAATFTPSSSTLTLSAFRPDASVGRNGVSAVVGAKGGP